MGGSRRSHSKASSTIFSNTFISHPSIDSNGFSKLSWVAHRFVDHVGKPRNKSVFLDNPHGFFGRELAVKETLEVLRLSLQPPTIEEHVLSLDPR